MMIKKKKDQFHHWFNSEVLPDIAPHTKQFPSFLVQVEPMQVPQTYASF